MERQPVSSSNILSVGHEGSTLEVEFLNGDTWQYQGVSRALFEQMLAAPSIGKFLNNTIKPRFPGMQS